MPRSPASCSKCSDCSRGRSQEPSALAGRRGLRRSPASGRALRLWRCCHISGMGCDTGGKRRNGTSPGWPDCLRLERQGETDRVATGEVRMYASAGATASLVEHANWATKSDQRLNTLDRLFPRSQSFFCKFASPVIPVPLAIRCTRPSAVELAARLSSQGGLLTRRSVARLGAASCAGPIGSEAPVRSSRGM